MSKSYQLNQVELIRAIMGEVSIQQPEAIVDGGLAAVIIDAANSICDAFKKKPATKGMGLQAFLNSISVTRASRYMASALSGKFPADFDYPHVSGDLASCFMLVEAVPEFSALVKNMELGHGLYWNAVISHWDELFDLYVQGNGEALFNCMHKAYEEAEKRMS